MPRVFYNDNGSSGGTVPVDPTVYANGDPVTVLGNTGSLVNGSIPFASWNTAANGSGTLRQPGAMFNIGAADVTLFAQWYATTGLTGAAPRRIINSVMIQVSPPGAWNPLARMLS